LSPLERTFVHLPGIGRSLERALWASGIDCWSALDAALADGIDIRRLGDPESRRAPQLGLGALDGDEERHSWRAALHHSGIALARKEFGYFAERLSTSEHWRILGSALDDALYLDLETTGLSRDLHALTLVGVMYRGATSQWVWSEALDDLASLLSEAPLVVTYNGARFDLPFLLHHVPSLPRPKLHIDLRSVAARGDLGGGQKAAEQALGLLRDSDLSEITGEQAIALWCSALYGDPAAYATLIKYNCADVQMLRTLADKLCQMMATQLIASSALSSTSSSSTGDVHNRGITCVQRAPAPLETVRASWRKRRPTLQALLDVTSGPLHRDPVVVGIDLRGNPNNPTGWVVSEGARITSRVLYDDESIFELTRDAHPDLVSIDAPLSLPRGRFAVGDDSPCRATGGIVRQAERVLWSRGIRVYPALIRHMQGLTARGIALSQRLRGVGIPVIESYPGAAQDVLGIARKGVSIAILERGLCDFGFTLPQELSHDELDAVTCALVGHFYLAQRYEAIGADDEGYMIIPQSNAIRWPGVRLSTTA